MGRYVIRRLLQMIPVIIGTTFLIYVMVWALPGNPFIGKCGERPCPEAYVQAQTDRLNLDDPLILQYLKYLGNLLQGDFGTTVNGVPVIDQVVAAYPNTVKLAVLSIIIEIVIGIAAGVLSALRRGGFIDNLVVVTSLFVISIPVFVIGFTLQYTVGIRWGLVSPTVGPGTPWGDLILPAIVLAGLSLAYVARLTRESLGESMRADYVRTATAKGMPRRRVVGRHALRNSLIPVITFIGADFGALLGGAIITEGIFNIRGLGSLVYRGIGLRESGTVVAVVTLLVLIFLFANLLVDLLYGALDPRIRFE